MDRTLEQWDVEREIERLMTEAGIDRVEAILLLGNRSSEVFGDGDLVCLHPLTDAQRTRLGLGRDFAEVMAEQHARQERDAAPPNGQPPRDTVADGATEPNGASRSRRAVGRAKEG